MKINFEMRILSVKANGMYDVDYLVLGCLVLVVINPLIIRMLKNLKGKKRTQV